MQSGGNVTISDSKASKQGGGGQPVGQVGHFFLGPCARDSVQMSWPLVVEPTGDPQPGCS